MASKENLNSKTDKERATGSAKIFVPEGFPKPEGKPKSGVKLGVVDGTKPKSKPKSQPATKPVPKAKIKAKPRPEPASKPRSRAKPKPVSGKKTRKPKRKSLISSLFGLPWPLGLMVLAGILLGVNFAYQVVNKPTEIVGLFDSKFHKSPSETWASYGDAFRTKSTSIMTPDLLAALAQMESNGNPIVRTYWRWRWNRDVSKIFAPASSAVGMFQITEGTFQEARHFCVRDGVAHQDGPQGMECVGNLTYSRLIPAHAIEMTSARLHLVAEHLVTRMKRRSHWSLQDKQDLAIVAHLCGAGKAERLARAGMRMSEIGRCGDHNPIGYTQQIHRLQAQFRAMEAKTSRVAALESE